MFALLNCLKQCEVQREQKMEMERKKKTDPYQELQNRSKELSLKNETIEKLKLKMMQLEVIFCVLF